MKKFKDLTTHEKILLYGLIVNIGNFIVKLIELFKK